MVEIFNTIMQYPLQFLAGLGISSGAIYTVCRIIKGVIGLITKKSAKAKELLQQQNIANAVVNAIGGVDGFCDKVANLVIEKITGCATVQDFKKYLEQLLLKDECPTELKAYIETVLSQSGSEQLKLLYEQTKSTLLAAAKSKVNEVIEQGTQSLEEVEIIEVEPVAEIAQPTAAKTTKQKTNEDGDITYA